MSEINDLRERVEAAEERFGLMDEQQRHYSERVIGLIETIEAQLAEARGEIEKQISENQRLGQENEELRTMLHSVLRSIEEKTFTQTLQNLESRVSALVSQAAPRAVKAQTAPESEADPDTAPALAAASDENAGESSDFAAAEGAGDEVPSDAALTAEAEMPETVAFEDADPAEIAAEAEAEAQDPEAPETEIPEDEAPATEAIEDDGQAAGTQAGSDDEGDDIFAAMNLLNADDEDFAAAAQGAAPLDDDVSIHEAAAAASDAAAPEMSTPESLEIEEEPVVEEAENALSDAIAERLADEVPEELAESVTPTVKEIIRRVGDLARELEHAETTRRRSQSDAQAEEAAGGPEPAASEAEGDAEPELDQAANA